MIEGPDEAIDALYSSIERDDRHCNIHLALERKIDQRIFPEWAMLDDEIETLTWPPEEVENGAVEAAPPEELLGIFERLADERRAGLPTE